jgi:hypothetical protein
MALKHGAQDEDFLGQLMIRYWGVGENLDSDEREILMFALASENKGLNGSIYRQGKEVFKKKFPKFDAEKI